MLSSYGIGGPNSKALRFYPTTPYSVRVSVLELSPGRVGPGPRKMAPSHISSVPFLVWGMVLIREL